MRLAYVAYLAVAAFIAAELTLRTLVQADPSYYVSFSDPEPGKEVQYAYGVIRFNADGYADDEFERTKRKPRIGYIGDSVCFGVGAGHGHRISEILERHYPQYEHMNFTGGLKNDPLALRDRVRMLNEQYDVDVFVYLMSLNDIRPTGARRLIEKPSRIRQLLDTLRGRSYVYTYLRMVARRIIARAEPPAFELFPRRYPDAFEQTGQRIEELASIVHAAGAELVIVLLPTEIQISADAATCYRAAGIEWDDETYPDGGAQRMLMSHVHGVVIADAYHAFIAQDGDGSERARYAAGECFVYNRGEKLDWVHPNRLGHRLIADYVAAQRVLDELDGRSIDPREE
jgi:lysophospholipase L1-like esterase